MIRLIKIMISMILRGLVFFKKNGVMEIISVIIFIGIIYSGNFLLIIFIRALIILSVFCIYKYISQVILNKEEGSPSLLLIKLNIKNKTFMKIIYNFVYYMPQNWLFLFILYVKAKYWDMKVGINSNKDILAKKIFNIDISQKVFILRGRWIKSIDKWIVMPIGRIYLISGYTRKIIREKEWIDLLRIRVLVMIYTMFLVIHNMHIILLMRDTTYITTNGKIIIGMVIIYLYVAIIWPYYLRSIKSGQGPRLGIANSVFTEPSIIGVKSLVGKHSLTFQFLERRIVGAFEEIRPNSTLFVNNNFYNYEYNLMKTGITATFRNSRTIKGYYILFGKYQKNYVYPFFTYYTIEESYFMIEDEIMIDSLYYYYMFKACKNCDIDFIYLDKQLEVDNEFYKCARLLYIINSSYYSKKKKKKWNISNPNNYINHQIKEIPVKVRSNKEIDKFAKLALSLYLPYKSGIKRLMEEKGDESQLYDGNWERSDGEAAMDEILVNDEFGEDQIEIVYENNKICFKKSKYPFFINTRRIVMEYKRESDVEMDIYYKKMKNEGKTDYEILKDYIRDYRKKYDC